MKQSLHADARAAGPGQHANATGLQDSSAFRKRMVIDQVVDYVVTLIALGEVLFRIIDYVIGADRSDQVQVFRAADAGYLRAKSLGDLDGKCSDASGRTIDQ